MISEDFKNAVKHERKIRHLSQEKFGKTLGTSQMTICSWENGKDIPYEFLFIVFCDAYGYKIKIGDDLMDYYGVSKWLKHERELQDLKQTELSIMCGFESSYIGTKETKRLGVASIDIIANALGYDPHLVKVGKFYDFE